VKVWVCLESLKPFRWAVRAGNKWHVVKRIITKIPLKTARGSIQPKAYLVGDGDVVIRNGTAIVRAPWMGKR
jgi:hypothetical protein